MKKAAVIITLLSLSLFAQQVTFTPVLHWRSMEIWTVNVSGGGSNQVLSNSDILLTAPSVRAYPTSLAQDLLNKEAARSTSSWIGQAWTTLSPAASAYLTTSGIIAKKNAQTYSGAGIALLSFAVAIWAKQAPNPSTYYSELLPQRVVLDQTGSGEWGIVAGWDKSNPNPKTIGPYPIKPKSTASFEMTGKDAWTLVSEGWDLTHSYIK